MLNDPLTGVYSRATLKQRLHEEIERAHQRKLDLLFRFGGDEFFLILPNTTKNQAVLFALRIQNGVCSQPFYGKPRTLSVSLGVSSFPEYACNPESLSEKAGQRDDEAKQCGPGYVTRGDAETRQGNKKE